jgi:hypothetical protein
VAALAQDGAIGVRAIGPAVVCQDAFEFKKRYGQGVSAYGDAKRVAQWEANHNNPDLIADYGRAYDVDRQ